jgi:acid phosphatase (class A)
MRRMGKTALVLAGALVCFGAEAAWAQPEIAAERLLPPPPAVGSPRAAAELVELKQLQAASTPEQLEAAAYDDHHEDGTIFTVVLGAGFDPEKLPATKQMLAAVGKAESAATTAPKAFFHRDRPWLVDSAIKTCTPHKPGPAANSYPSGHTTVGFAMAEVMAALVPDKAQPLLARATVFAENRLVCGYHFRSDIVAGQELGTVLALRLMADPAFQAQMAASRRELQAAHITP